MMKLKLLGLVAGAALMALQSANASAHTDVVVGVQLGIPAPVIVAPYPAVHYHWVERAPARHYYSRAYPRRHAYGHRYKVRCHERHDRGRHRGHSRHH